MNGVSIVFARSQSSASSSWKVLDKWFRSVRPAQSGEKLELSIHPQNLQSICSSIHVVPLAGSKWPQLWVCTGLPGFLCTWLATPQGTWGQSKGHLIHIVWSSAMSFCAKHGDQHNCTLQGLPISFNCTDQLGLAWASSHYRLNPWRRPEQHQAGLQSFPLSAQTSWHTSFSWYQVSWCFMRMIHDERTGSNMNWLI